MPPHDFRGLGIGQLKFRRNVARSQGVDPTILAALKRRLAIAQNRTAGIGRQGVEAIREGAPNAAELRAKRDMALGITKPGNPVPPMDPNLLKPGFQNQGRPNPPGLARGLRGTQPGQNRANQIKRRMRKPRYGNLGRPVV